MKKIVSAVTAAGLLAGAAFADVSVSYTSKNYIQAGSGNVKYDNSTTDDNKLAGANRNARKDCLALTVKNDVFGAVLDMDLEGNVLKMDEYYGWMNFSGISTQITAGAWNSRYVDRVVTDKRGVSFDDQDFELFKPGVIDVREYRYATEDDSNYRRGDFTHSVAYDSDNLTKGNLAMVAAYTNTSLPGTLMIKAGLVDVTGMTGNGKLSTTGAWSEGNSRTGVDTTNEYSSVKVYAGFAGEVAYRQDNLFALNLAVRSYQDHTASAALFFSPLMIENLQATAGLTFGFNGAGVVNTAESKMYASDGNWSRGDDIIHKYDGTVGVEWALDLRLRYAFSDRLSITTMHNFSSYLSTLQIEERHGASGAQGTVGYQDETKWSTNDFAMWNMLNLTYDFAEKLTAGFTVQHLNTDMDKRYEEHNHFWFSPSLTIAATENVKFTVIARNHWQNMAADTCYYNLAVPVLFTFNY